MSVRGLDRSVVVRRRVRGLCRGLDRSVVVRGGVGGLRKGSEKRLGEV